MKRCVAHHKHCYNRYEILSLNTICGTQLGKTKATNHYDGFDVMLLGCHAMYMMGIVFSAIYYDIDTVSLLDKSNENIYRCDERMF